VEPPLIASFQSTRSTILISVAWFSAIYVSSHIDQVDARRAHAKTKAKMWYGKMPRVPYQLQKWYGICRVCCIGAGATAHTRGNKQAIVNNHAKMTPRKTAKYIYTDKHDQKL